MKTIKYKDTLLTLEHYKEPLRAVEKGVGVGYYGALLSTLEGDKVQCHVCGELFSSLQFHIMKKHDLKPREYKTKFGLAYSTALISESLRAHFKERTMDWLNSLTPKEKETYMEVQRERLMKARISNNTNMAHPIQLETMNKRGTCPDQLLDKILEVKGKLGRVPTSKEFVQILGTQRYKHLIFKVFGSWNNALKMIGERPPKPRGEYEDTQLLEYLRMYTKKYSKVPTHTDFKRKLLPDLGTYIKHFGSINEARKLAGVYEMVNV